MLAIVCTVPVRSDKAVVGEWCQLGARLEPFGARALFSMRSTRSSSKFLLVGGCSNTQTRFPLAQRSQGPSLPVLTQRFLPVKSERARRAVSGEPVSRSWQASAHLCDSSRKPWHPIE